MVALTLGAMSLATRGSGNNSILAHGVVQKLETNQYTKTDENDTMPLSFSFSRRKQQNLENSQHGCDLSSDCGVFTANFVDGPLLPRPAVPPPESLPSDSGETDVPDFFSCRGDSVSEQGSGLRSTTQNQQPALDDYIPELSGFYDKTTDLSALKYVVRSMLPMLNTGLRRT